MFGKNIIMKMLIVIKALDNQKKMTYCFSVIINVTSVCL